MVSQVMLVAPISMIGVGMCDHRIINRLPGVDVKPTLRATNSLIRKFKQWFFGHKVLTAISPIGFKQEIPVTPGFLCFYFLFLKLGTVNLGHLGVHADVIRNNLP